MRPCLQEVDASAVFYNRDATPAGLEKCRRMNKELEHHGILSHVFHGASLLYEPETVPVKTGFHGGYRFPPDVPAILHSFL